MAASRFTQQLPGCVGFFPRPLLISSKHASTARRVSETEASLITVAVVGLRLIFHRQRRGLLSRHCVLYVPVLQTHSLRSTCCAEGPGESPARTAPGPSSGKSRGKAEVVGRAACCQVKDSFDAVLVPTLRRGFSFAPEETAGRNKSIHWHTKQGALRFGSCLGS